MFSFAAIKELFGAKKQDTAKDDKAKQHELFERQLAHDRALVILSKKLHECQAQRKEKWEKLESIWGDGIMENSLFTEASFDTDATILDSDLGSLRDDLETLDRRERALQSEIYFKLREQESQVKKQQSKDPKPSAKVSHETFFQRLVSSFSYARRWVHEFCRGLALKAICACLLK